MGVQTGKEEPLQDWADARAWILCHSSCSPRTPSVTLGQAAWPSFTLWIKYWTSPLTGLRRSDELTQQLAKRPAEVRNCYYLLRNVISIPAG